MGRFCLFLLILVGCSHDTDRANPVDPQLTPAVTLSVHLDSSGAAQLSWTAYQGEQPFARYLVLRNVARSTQVDTLATISDAALVEFRDTVLTPDTAYQYRIGAENAAGFVSTSDPLRIDGFTISAVHLQPVEEDAAAGSLTLRWTRYRDPGFTQYQVLRRQVGTDAEIALADIKAMMDTTYVDTSARHQTEYLYRIGVEAAGQALVSTPEIGRLDLPSVSVQSVVMQSESASSTVSWTPYSGPRFSHYEMHRLVEGALDSLVASIGDISITEWSDTGLLGNTEYGYHATVVTDADERVSGDGGSGRLHRLVGSLPLEVNPRLRHSRLSIATDGALNVAVSGSVDDNRFGGGTLRTDALRLAEWNDDSGLWSIVKNLNLARNGNPNTARSLLFRDDQPDLVLLANRSDIQGNAAPDRVAVGEWAVDGLVRQRRDLFSQLATGEPISGPVTVRLGVIGEWTLADKLTVTLDGTLATRVETLPLRGWEYADRTGATFFHGRTRLANTGEREEVWISYTDTVASSARFEVDVMRAPDDTEQFGYASIAIETETGSVELTLDFETDRLILERYDAGSSEPAESFSEPFLWASNVDYQLGLAIEGGQAEAWIEDPVGWLIEKEDSSDWAHLAATDDHVFAIVDEQPYRLETDGTTPMNPLVSAPSDVQVWPASRGSYVGMVMPELNQVFQGISRDGDWPLRVNAWLSADRTIGGSGEGQFLYPTAMAAGSDGRVYVVDAGNSRIQVFDERGNYITQWGSFGSGDGQFNFGRGETLPNGGLDFAGSIAVDRDGFIYVADVGNERIQKFAP